MAGINRLMYPSRPSHFQRQYRYKQTRWKHLHKFASTQKRPDTCLLEGLSVQLVSIEGSEIINKIWYLKYMHYAYTYQEVVHPTFNNTTCLWSRARMRTGGGACNFQWTISCIAIYMYLCIYFVMIIKIFFYFFSLVFFFCFLGGFFFVGFFFLAIFCFVY